MCSAVASSPLPTTLLSITLESTLTTSLEHSLRSPIARKRDRKGVRLLSDQAFANHPPSIIKRTHQKEQRSHQFRVISTLIYMAISVFPTSDAPIIWKEYSSVSAPPPLVNRSLRPITYKLFCLCAPNPRSPKVLCMEPYYCSSPFEPL